jgi:hypothetical protein
MKTTFALVLLSLSTVAFAQNSAPVISTRMSGTFADDTFSINGNTAHIAVSQDSNSGQTLLIYNYLRSNSDGSTSFIFGGRLHPE